MPYYLLEVVRSADLFLQVLVAQNLRIYGHIRVQSQTIKKEATPEMTNGIILCDVAPRDGIQNEGKHLSPAQRYELIRLLAHAGLHWIEVASFASPKWVPQMAGAEEVLRLSAAIPGIRPIVLVLDDRGYEPAVTAGARYIRLVVAATDTMNRKNANNSPQLTMASYKPIFENSRRDNVELAGTIATSFGCPFEGAVDPEGVLRLAAQFVEAGVAEIDFADTVGMAVPPQIERLVVRARREFPEVRIGIHVHNTRDIGLANAYAAVKTGADVLDASTGGAGGCPFAPKATGNIPMEDLVFMLEGARIPTGIDLPKLIEASRRFEEMLEHPLPAMLPKAGPCWEEPPPLA